MVVTKSVPFSSSQIGFGVSVRGSVGGALRRGARGHAPTDDRPRDRATPCLPVDFVDTRAICGQRKGNCQVSLLFFGISARQARARGVSLGGHPRPLCVCPPFVSPTPGPANFFRNLDRKSCFQREICFVYPWWLGESWESEV